VIGKKESKEGVKVARKVVMKKRHVIIESFDTKVLLPPLKEALYIVLDATL
jgi:hypothetical protein